MLGRGERGPGKAGHPDETLQGAGNAKLLGKGEWDGGGEGPLGLGPTFMKFLKLRLLTLLLDEFIHTVLECV